MQVSGIKYLIFCIRHDYTHQVAIIPVLARALLCAQHCCFLTAPEQEHNREKFANILAARLAKRTVINIKRPVQTLPHYPCLI